MSAPESTSESSSESPLARIGAALGSKVVSGRQLAGGDLGGAMLVDLADGRKAVAKQGPLVSVEADMLRAIRQACGRAPDILFCEGDLLVMDFVESTGRPDEAGWRDLAEVLGTLHADTGEPFGWQADYVFGPVAILNEAAEDWPAFWAERRLLCHGEKISEHLTGRLAKLAEKLPDLLPATPPSSLLHGDLWGGNVLFGQGRLNALIDPAAYRGHREVDVAMLTLFDHPTDAFFEALELEAGWRERLRIYRLWPLLVHLRLFGTSYRAAIDRELSAFGC
ncbi:fructosamine kinase family protein [Paraurantiacibacter namhicola]|uniref:Fructosamine kinase n=1 Tax=Paraurantiacibacter namhicola TaxID=645517 RepID=A0A1C7D6Y2_9SPHN|nr:fructosamine kinase family protein [Paraurantiacibacter namhicola]ANU07208.1 Fructosamine kinase [Paraurantiacibacter namhicola]